MEVRRPVSHKLTDKVTTHLPEYLAETLRQLANQASCSEAELLRDMICLSLCGLTWGEHVANSRRSILKVEGATPAQTSAMNGPQE
jgi:hypothetical protein